MGSVNIKAMTVGEFDLAVSVWLIDPEDPENEIDAIADFEGDYALREAEEWCQKHGHSVVQRPSDY